MSKSTNVLIVENCQLCLSRIDELLTELHKDERYKMRDSKGNKLHDATNVLGNIAIQLRRLKERLSQ